MTVKLEARRRVGTGKGAGRRIRNTGLIPAVLYGDGKDPVNLALEPKALKAIVTGAKGLNSTFSVSVDGGETVELARVVSIQKHPVRRTLVHADIQRLNPARRLKFKVPIAMDGVGPAQKLGCKIRHVTRYVKVMCLPEEVPASLAVDMTKLEPGSDIRLSELVVPENLKLLYKDNAPVVVANAAPVAKAEEEEEG